MDFKAFFKATIIALIGLVAAAASVRLDAYVYGVQRLYHPGLGMTVDIAHEYHDLIPGVTQHRKEMERGFCALDKKGRKKGKVLWEYADEYWAGCHEHTSGNCMIPVGHCLCRKLKHNLTFVEADTIRHSPTLAEFDDFICDKFDQADREERMLDDVLRSLDGDELKEKLEVACQFIEEISEDGADDALFHFDEIEYKPALRYAQKTWQASKKRMICCYNTCAKKNSKKVCRQAIVDLKDDLFDGVADLEFFCKLWANQAKYSVVYAGGAHCRTLADALKGLGFKAVKSLGLAQDDKPGKPQPLKMTQFFAFLER